jgi:hypothetical protein
MGMRAMAESIGVPPRRLMLIDELFGELCRRTSTKMRKHLPLDIASGTCYPLDTPVFLSAG